MTRMLDKAIEKARALSGQEQDALAFVILSEIDAMSEPLDDKTRAAIQEGLEQARRGEFASEDEMQALWKKYGA